MENEAKSTVASPSSELKPTPALNAAQRRRAMLIAESRGLDDETAFEIVALRDFVTYVREFYQRNFDVMPVAFQTVDNEAAALLGED